MKKLMIAAISTVALFSTGANAQFNAQLAEQIKNYDNIEFREYAKSVNDQLSRLSGTYSDEATLVERPYLDPVWREFYYRYTLDLDKMGVSYEDVMEYEGNFQAWDVERLCNGKYERLMLEADLNHSFLYRTTEGEFLFETYVTKNDCQ